MQSIISVSPFRCRMWAWHDRLEDYVSEQSCKTEIDSFHRHGQLVPVLGRPVTGDTDHDVELIYGARRLFVARYLNTPLKVELREVSDREALVAMDIENRHRADISPYERGLSYARWLRSGHFSSQEEIARALHVSSSQVCRLLKLARLPSAVVAAFVSPLDIREGWGGELTDAWDDPVRRPQLLKTARALTAKSPRPPAHEIHQQLISQVVRAQRVRSMPHDEVVKDASGKPLLRVSRQRKCVSLSIPNARLSVTKLREIKQFVAQVLQRESP